MNEQQYGQHGRDETQNDVVDEAAAARGQSSGGDEDTSGADSGTGEDDDDDTDDDSDDSDDSDAGTVEHKKRTLRDRFGGRSR